MRFDAVFTMSDAVISETSVKKQTYCNYSMFAS